MKYILFSFLLQFSSLNIFGQEDTLGPVNKLLLRSTLMIKTDSGIGSGFLVSEGASKIFLVTNKHLVGNYSPVDSLILYKKINITLYTTDLKRPTITKDVVLIDSSGKKSTKLRLHPNHKIDIAIIDVTDIVKNFPDNNLVFIDTSFIKPLNNLAKVISYGSHVFTIGYPAGIRSFRTNQPVIKSGYVASSILGDLIVEQSWKSRTGANKNTVSEGKIFLVDGLIIPGNSGGPVVSSREVTWMIVNKQLQHVSEPDNYILGIVSNIYENTGITVVFSSEHILELIRSSSK